jgi:hypothetical protein
MPKCLTVAEQAKAILDRDGPGRKIARWVWRPWMAADMRLAEQVAIRMLETDVISMLSVMLPVADGDPARTGRVGQDILSGTLGQNPASRAVRDAYAYAFGACGKAPSFEGCESWSHPHEKACECFARELAGPQSAGQRFKVEDSVSGALADSMNYCVGQKVVRWPTEAYEARALAKELGETLREGVDVESKLSPLRAVIAMC